MKRFISLLLCSLLIFTITTAFAEAPNDAQNPYLILVNKENRLPDNWLDYIKLVETQNSLGETFLVEDAALQHFDTLRTYLLENEGIQIELDSTYRSIKEQQEIWDEWSADPEKGPDYCAQYLSPVGYSEHHTGLAIDVFIIKPDGTHERENDDMIADTETFAKIHAHLAQFGFILRYLPGKEDITGYAYEPWHFRFVGEDIAKEVTENHLTLEEYLAQKSE